MDIKCGRCRKGNKVLNGYVQCRQRYRCKDCGYNFTGVDSRKKYDDRIKELVIRMYLNNCGFRRISSILRIPLATCFVWIKKAGEIVDGIVKEKQLSDVEKKDIEVLEMDELYTYIKKNLKERRKRVCQIFCVSSSNHEALTLSDSVSSRIWNCCRASFQFLIGIVHFLAAFVKHKYKTLK